MGLLPRWRSITHLFGQVGHTHGPIDQRLGTVSAAFAAQKVIETPQDCRDKTSSLIKVFLDSLVDNGATHLVPLRTSWR